MGWLRKRPDDANLRGLGLNSAQRATVRGAWDVPGRQLTQAQQKALEDYEAAVAKRRRR